MSEAALDCEGYRGLLAAVERDEAMNRGRPAHDYRGKLDWTVARARHYAEKTGLRVEDILDAWEEQRSYWYMNFYQDCNQPIIEGDRVRVFENTEDLKAALEGKGFRCPACAGISSSPYECDSGIVRYGKPCDWKSYGLFRTLGKGVHVFVKEHMRFSELFMPVAWEKP